MSRKQKNPSTRERFSFRKCWATLPAEDAERSFSPHAHVCHRPSNHVTASELEEKVHACSVKGCSVTWEG